MVIDELKKRYKLEEEDGKIKIVPLNRFEFRTYPIAEEEKTLQLTEDEFVGLATRLYMLTEDLTAVEPFSFDEFRAFAKARLAENPKGGAEK